MNQSRIKNTKFILNLLSKKKINNFFLSQKFLFKMNLVNFYQPKITLNYSVYPILLNKIIRQFLRAGTIIGVGHNNYYSLEFSKKFKFDKKKLYLSKLNVKKESRFFYGICISKKNNLLNSTITLRNVYYNEIIEKSFFIFNPWNSVISTINVNSLLNAWKYSGFSLRNKWFYLRNKPRQYSKITLR